ncbi:MULTISPECIES: amino acid ABC transporter permease [Helicobacter]|uniref:Amino acid ABC transporter permease n=1 Tax=Helicobacter colisuis TaxID=2949739 RepID=A0ABT0TTD2_9HELI|nr:MULTISPECIES: amino acid ABC transporter permease [Helicobacter]MCI2235874.1 amino acid ABC transporter permease [Helicobacter sp. CaF467b]MCI7047791.1 amino acid ABC transporter permease [Helicobacter sp.]MCL9819188.1 amino acid ABC transporter permease [Helicobacter colisuis]MDY4426187.1 amino acid ABC transporter permease [Helicobacter sp.]MDY5616149.1 amino acid ABC transporter permease [Helicobacter sp.]
MLEYLEILKEVFINESRYWYLVEGLGFSIATTALSALIGIALGILIALMQLSTWRVLSKLAFAYVYIIRGTPVVVQLMIWANIVFVGALRDMPILLIAAIAFGINSGAYVAEIIRAGIAGLDKGQMEAARALGMGYALSMKEIIIPQAIKRILPPLVSEFIALLKETSIVGFIGGVDLLRAANIITSQTYRAIEPLLAVGIIYLILTSIFAMLMRKVEKRLKESD